MSFCSEFFLIMLYFVFISRKQKVLPVATIIIFSMTLIALLT